MSQWDSFYSDGTQSAAARPRHCVRLESTGRTSGRQHLLVKTKTKSARHNAAETSSSSHAELTFDLSAADDHEHNNTRRNTGSALFTPSYKPVFNETTCIWFSFCRFITHVVLTESTEFELLKFPKTLNVSALIWRECGKWDEGTKHVF